MLAALAGCTALPDGGYRVGGGSGPGCALSRVAIVPVTAYDGLLFVTAHVDGKPVRLVLDTGAQRSLLTEATVRRLGLPADRDHGTRTWGIGGPTTSFDAVVRRFTLAGVAFTMPRITVGRFRLAALRGGADGMLGADVLTLFGIDLDAAAGRMVLYRDPACRLVRPPWDGPAVDLPGVQAGGNRLRLPIAVNGTQGMATLDTGAQTTAIGLGLALRAGVTPSALAADRYTLARGAAPAAVHGPAAAVPLLAGRALAGAGPRVADHSPARRRRRRVGGRGLLAAPAGLALLRRAAGVRRRGGGENTAGFPIGRGVVAGRMRRMREPAVPSASPTPPHRLPNQLPWGRTCAESRASSIWPDNGRWIVRCCDG